MDRLVGMFQQIGQDPVLHTVGNDDLDALLGHLGGDGRLGQHAAAAETAPAELDITAQVLARLNPPDDLRPGHLRISVIDTVDIAQDNQYIRRHHRSDHPRKFIIVRKHQFRDAHGIVLVDDGDDIAAQHHLHAVTLVEIFPAGGEILLHRQDLTGMDAVFGEKLPVMRHQAHLSDGGKELALLHFVQFVLGFDETAAAGHGTAGNENHFMSHTHHARNLPHQRTHPCNIQRPVFFRQDIAAYFDNQSHAIYFLLSNL